MIKLQNYNEFKNGVRWHDYFNIMVNEFPIILIRKYDWDEIDTYTFVVQVMGVKVYQRIGEYK
jgi:hypothetical protein